MWVKGEFVFRYKFTLHNKTMKTLHSTVFPTVFSTKIAGILLLSAFAGGCVSPTDRIRSEIKGLTDRGEFSKARSVKAENADERSVKEEMISNIVNPAETRFVTNSISEKVTELVKARRFDEARDLLWKPGPDLVPEVQVPVKNFKDELRLKYVNRTQFVLVTNEMAKSVAAAVAKKDFAAARKALDNIRPVRVYSKEVDSALSGVHDALVAAKVPATVADRIAGSVRPVFEKLFEDLFYEARTVQPGDMFQPDQQKYHAALKEMERALAVYGVDFTTVEKVSGAVDKIVQKEFHALWIPQEPCEIAPPDAIGTTELNKRIEAAKKELLEHSIVPAQIASRIAELRSRVVPLVEDGSLDEARAAIYEYGVTGYAEVDDPVFAVKLALLNTRVNPATLATRSAELVKAVDDALADGDFAAASDAIAAVQTVSALSTHVNDALAKAASDTAALGIPAEGAATVVSDAQETLYDVLAPRPDAVRDSRALAAYARELSAMEETPAELDWSAVRATLDNAAGWLVADDMPRDEANRLMSDVLSAFQSLVETPSAKVETLTTAELNRRLADLKAELSAKVSSAVAEKLAADANAKAAADAAASAAEAEKMRALALEMAERAASAVDFEARIAGFVEAVGDRVEPDMNRILGDGARVLRLRRAGSAITPADASSLLVAAVYMGFDDVMNLALTLGADIDAPSPKDTLKRPALLVALQYGWRGHAAAVLAKADRAVRDARGDGALHYAVRGGCGAAIPELLRAGIDAKIAGAGGATPIILAADLGYIGFVRALIPFSELEKSDDEGFTALLRAAQDGRLDIVRILDAAGADLGAKTTAGDGALELAAMANAQDLLSWLLDEKKVSTTDRIVSQLVIAGNVPTLQFVVGHGGRLADEHLATSVKQGDFPMVKYLVNCGMDVNADVVKAACDKPVDPGTGPDAGPNDGSFHGPAGETIRAFLRAQGQRP